MPSKKISKTTLPVPLSRDVARSINMDGELVPVDAVFHVPSVHPSSAGPWANEPDKVAWVNEMSGYGCIIRRQANNGTLSGFVGVDPSHPLFQMSYGALVGLGIKIHGGVRYSAACESEKPESISICHPGGVRRSMDIHVDLNVQQRAGSDRDDAWWLGFHCDLPTDVIPNARALDQGDPALAGVDEPTYRDIGYVYHQCILLAAQLRAIADGRDPAELANERVSLLSDDLRSEGNGHA